MDENKSLPQFTCLTCHVAFKASDQQREHYRSDWHRYNLKRKILDLPPISAEDFQKKVINQSTIEQTPQNEEQYCGSCRKSFKNQNSYDNHLNSKKHKENEKLQSSQGDIPKVNEEIEVEEVDSDEWDEEAENPIETNNCIFCGCLNKNFIKNLEHMTTAHSFFIPDIEYCTDVYGLLSYLADKVVNGFMCLWCNETGKTFHSADAVRKHMIDKGHCRMLQEGDALIEYAEFYDYSSSYPDAKDHSNPDEEVNVPVLDSTEYQLVLPSGATIGHRSLMRYYKQSLNPNSTALVAKNSTRLHKAMSCYKALGWVGTDKKEAAMKARDFYFMRRFQAKMSLHLGVKGNKLQKHFRPQVNF